MLQIRRTPLHSVRFRFPNKCLGTIFAEPSSAIKTESYVLNFGFSFLMTKRYARSQPMLRCTFKSTSTVREAKNHHADGRPVLFLKAVKLSVDLRLEAKSKNEISLNGSPC